MPIKIKLTYDADFEKLLGNLGKDSDEIGKKTVYSGAGVVADTVRRYLAPHHDSGSLEGSIGIAKIQVSKNINTKVGFNGYDKARSSKAFPNGVPELIKIRVLEKRKGVFSRAIRNARPKAQEAMDNTMNSEIDKRIK